MTSRKREPEIMSTENTPLAGRAATPAPPNAGQSSLGAVLGLGEDPRLQSRRWIHAIATPGLVRALESRSLDVFPAAPGLAVESLLALPIHTLVVEDSACDKGPWAGVGSGIAPELDAQLTELVSTCHARAVPVIRVHCRGDEPSPRCDVDSPLAIALDGAVVVAPGTAMFEGTEEGAPASRLVRALQSYIGSKPSGTA